MCVEVPTQKILEFKKTNQNGFESVGLLYQQKRSYAIQTNFILLSQSNTFFSYNLITYINHFEHFT